MDLIKWLLENPVEQATLAGIVSWAVVAIAVRIGAWERGEAKLQKRVLAFLTAGLAVALPAVVAQGQGEAVSWSVVVIQVITAAVGAGGLKGYIRSIAEKLTRSGPPV